MIKASFYTLFVLEDIYGLKMSKMDGKPCLQFDSVIIDQFSSLGKMVHAWQLEAAKLESGEITKEDYDNWRYNYPAKDTSGRWVKVISPELNDMLMEELQKIEKKTDRSKEEQEKMSTKKTYRLSLI